MFIVGEARIESRIWILDTRTSNWKLPVHRTGLPGNEISFILRPLGALAGQVSCFDTNIVTVNPFSFL